MLTPGRYVGSQEVEADGEALEAKIERLTTVVRGAVKRRQEAQAGVLAALDALVASGE